MLTKNNIKHIIALKQKKFRDEFQQFVAEGDKLVNELLHSHYKISEIFALKEWLDNKDIADTIQVTAVSPAELERISSLTTANKVIALLEIPRQQAIDNSIFKKLVLCLDEINDPGNMGTIIRIADWFGISDIICSNHSVDAYNPKVVQASMGSIARVKIHYTDLATFFKSLPEEIPVYGTLLNGENIYTQTLTANGIIVLGNESRGISEEIQNFILHKLYIPSYAENPMNKAESLNAAVAAAVVCAEFKRRSY